MPGSYARAALRTRAQPGPRSDRACPAACGSCRRLPPPTLDRAETCPGDRGGPPRAHTAKISGAENHGGPGPASRVPAHTLTGRERETRTQSAGAIARTQDAAQDYGSRSGLTLDSSAAGRGEAPGPGRGDHSVPAPKYPREKIFTAGGPYKVPARAAHVIPRRLSPQANHTHAAPARKAALSSLPARRSAAAAPRQEKRGFPNFSPIRVCPRQKSESDPRALPPCLRRRETPPHPLKVSGPLPKCPVSPLTREFSPDQLPAAAHDQTGPARTWPELRP